MQVTKYFQAHAPLINPQCTAMVARVPPFVKTMVALPFLELFYAKMIYLLPSTVLEGESHKTFFTTGLPNTSRQTSLVKSYVLCSRKLEGPE